MAYYNNNFKGRSNHYPRRKKNKYSESEKLAFKMGQEARIRRNLSNKVDSKVVDSYYKGLNGIANQESKSLF